MASALADMQAALQRDILTGKTDSLHRLAVPEGANPEKRLFVYQNAYVTRLLDYLCEDYDTTWTFLGDQNFYSLAQAYIRACPSQTPNARWYSHRFPKFLESAEIAQDVPAVPEVARIERAVADAFDAPNATPLTRADLEQAAGAGLETALFTLHPSLSLLRLETNAYDIFRALRAGETPPVPKREFESRWVIAWRRDLTCRHMEPNAEQGALLQLALEGRNFAQLCEVSATMDDPDTAAIRMAQYLAGWIDNGLITGFH